MDNFFGTYQNNNKAFKSLSQFQYENIFKLGVEDDKVWYNLLNTINIPDNINQNIYTYIKPLPSDTWTNISYIYYNTTELWWLIALINKVYNPWIMPKILKIIKPEYIDIIIDNIQHQLN